jgi:hypothetical protein
VDNQGILKICEILFKTVFWMEAILDRLMISDGQWDRLKDMVPGEAGDPGVPAAIRDVRHHT